MSLITDMVTCFSANPSPSGDGHFVRHTRIIVTHYGGPDALQVIEEECPQPQPGEVRVRVMAAGVSLSDVLAREGVHPETPRVPYTPGWDLVGTLDQLSEGVSGLELGETVAACRSAAVTRNMFACRNASSFQCPQVWTQQKPWPSS